MKEMRKARRALICGTLMILVMLVTACGAGGASTGVSGGNTGGASPASTPTASPRAKKISVNAGDTSLCDIISASEFAQAVGVPASQLKVTANNTKSPNGAILVLCGFIPNEGYQSGGAIDYAISDDGLAYYTTVNQEEQDQWTSVNTLTGVGAAAIWGTDSTADDVFNLNMLKDNVVVGITMDGSASDGSAYLPAAEQLARKIASAL